MDNRLAMLIWEVQDGAPIGPMPWHLDNMINIKNLRIITCKKSLYFLVQKNHSILSYKNVYLLVHQLQIFNMPTNNEYET